MLPPSYFRQMITKVQILFVLNLFIALFMTALLGGMLWAITIKPAWPFAIIALLALIGADLARHHAAQLLRQRAFWKKFLP